MKSKGKEKVIEEQPLRLEVNLPTEIECSVKRASESSNKFQALELVPATEVEEIEKGTSDFESPEPGSMMDKIQAIDKVEKLISTSTRKKQRKTRGKSKQSLNSRLVAPCEGLRSSLSQ